MSVEAMAIVLHHSESSGTEKVVLLGVANHSGDGGAWPTVDTLARYARVGPRAVQGAIRRLCETGELTVEQNVGGTAETRDDRRPNRYTILVRCPDDCDGTTNHRSRGVKSTTPRGDDGVQAGAERGAAERADGVQPASPEPSVQPSLEPSLAGATDILNEWWERNRDEHNYKPVAKAAYVAARGIVRGVLAAGYADAEVREALARIGPRVFTKKSLTDQCYAIRLEHASQPPPWFQREADGG